MPNLVNDAFNWVNDINTLNPLIYKYMKAEHIKSFSDRNLCDFINLKFTDPAANYHMSPRCMQEALTTTPALDTNLYGAAFYRRPDNANIFSQINGVTLNKIGARPDTLYDLQDSQLDELLKVVAAPNSPGDKLKTQIKDSFAGVDFKKLKDTKKENLNNVHWKVLKLEERIDRLVISGKFKELDGVLKQPGAEGLLKNIAFKEKSTSNNSTHFSATKTRNVPLVHRRVSKFCSV